MKIDLSYNWISFIFCKWLHTTLSRSVGCYAITFCWCYAIKFCWVLRYHILLGVIIWIHSLQQGCLCVLCVKTITIIYWMTICIIVILTRQQDEHFRYGKIMRRGHAIPLCTNRDRRLLPDNGNVIIVFILENITRDFMHCWDDGRTLGNEVKNNMQHVTQYQIFNITK